MARIAFIGAGSAGFTRRLTRDILSFDRLRDSTLVLMDISAERLELARMAVQATIDRKNSPAKIVTTTSREKALEGADAVVITILVGGVDVWQHDILIPKKFGVDVSVGDTRGPSGIFRALRTIPVMLDICRDVERIAPDAIVLNYTNPMAMLTKSILTGLRPGGAGTKLTATGLCHSVQGTAWMLADWIGAPRNEVDYVCAGINHLSWYRTFTWKGRDAYPLIRKAIARKEIYGRERVRNEMFLALGHYVTESSWHNSEYNAWFRKRPDLIRKYVPDSHAVTLRHYRKQDRFWKRNLLRSLAHPEEFHVNRGGDEYAPFILNAWMGGETAEFNGNVLNTGLVSNLPEGSCVEVPVVASRRAIKPVVVGALPPQCAALSGLHAQIEDMAVDAALTGDSRLVYQAICHDPLTSAVCSLAEIRSMTQAMFKKNRRHLPQFKSVDF
jgi:alpha-galactosidase